MPRRICVKGTVPGMPHCKRHAEKISWGCKPVSSPSSPPALQSPPSLSQVQFLPVLEQCAPWAMMRKRSLRRSAMLNQKVPSALDPQMMLLVREGTSTTSRAPENLTRTSRSNSLGAVEPQSVLAVLKSLDSERVLPVSARGFPGSAFLMWGGTYFGLAGEGEAESVMRACAGTYLASVSTTCPPFSSTFFTPKLLFLRLANNREILKDCQLCKAHACWAW